MGTNEDNMKRNTAPECARPLPTQIHPSISVTEVIPEPAHECTCTEGHDELFIGRTTEGLVWWFQCSDCGTVASPRVLD
jgi:hypothetical protein